MYNSRSTPKGYSDIMEIANLLLALSIMCVCECDLQCASNRFC